MTGNNIHPIFQKQLLSKEDRLRRLNQNPKVIWLCGLSGSGKSTLAVALEKKLFDSGFFPYVLDGDNIRTGLNKNLGFTSEDRTENLRRIAEVAKLFVDSGIIPITSFITPLESQRENAKGIIGKDDYIEVFVDCPFEVCEKRDVKGLYAKAKAGEIKNFTGKQSIFEIPAKPNVHLRTEVESPEQSLNKLLSYLKPIITK